MSPGGTVEALHLPGDSVLHRLPAEAKLAATLAFVLAVVATPREAFWAFAAHGAVLAVLAAASGFTLAFVGRRLLIEVPFLVFALSLPILGRSPRIDVVGLSLSEPGLWAGWNLAVKGTLGLFAAIVLVGSTPVAELLRGLERLRVPSVLVAIAGFMVRYVSVVAGEADRMRIARLSRGDDPRWLWQARATAATAGTLFVRSYERGERVHLAMLARGYDGAMPQTVERRATPGGTWLLAATVPLAGIAVAVVALVQAG